jgi:hypothetical protein
MVVRSAVTAFHGEGRNKPLEAFSKADQSINFAKRPSGILDLTPAREGVFNLAVCDDPAGHYISSVNTREGRHFPCQCLAPDQDRWTPNIPLAEEHMGYFLDVSGFSRSRDFFQGCVQRSKYKVEEMKDRQECTPWYGTNVRKWYTRTNFTKESDADGTMREAFRSCETILGDRRIVGVSQCERKNGKNCVGKNEP